MQLREARAAVATVRPQGTYIQEELFWWTCWELLWWAILSSAIALTFTGTLPKGNMGFGPSRRLTVRVQRLPTLVVVTDVTIAGPSPPVW